MARSASMDEDVRAPAREHSPLTVVFVLEALIVAVTLAVEALSCGRLYVLVEVDDAAEADALIVCVYPGDVADVLAAGNVSAYPQAEAAVSVQPGREVEIAGRWRGTYTVAVFTQAGALDGRAGVLVVRVGKDETHAAFKLG